MKFDWAFLAIRRNLDLEFWYIESDIESFLVVLFLIRNNEMTSRILELA